MEERNFLKIWGNLGYMAHLEDSENYVDGGAVPRKEILQEFKHAGTYYDVRVKAYIEVRLSNNKKIEFFGVPTIMRRLAFGDATYLPQNFIQNPHPRRSPNCSQSQ